jgi:hypothetical protein
MLLRIEVYVKRKWINLTLIATDKPIKFLYKMAHKTLENRGKLFGARCHVTFAPFCTCTHKNGWNSFNKCEFVNVRECHPTSVTPWLQRETSGVHPFYRRLSFEPHNTRYHIAKHKRLVFTLNELYSAHTTFLIKELLKMQMPFRPVFNNDWSVPRATPDNDFLYSRFTNAGLCRKRLANLKTKLKNT